MCRREHPRGGLQKHNPVTKADGYRCVFAAVQLLYMDPYYEDVIDTEAQNSPHPPSLSCSSCIVVCGTCVQMLARLHPLVYQVENPRQVRWRAEESKLKSPGCGVMGKASHFRIPLFTGVRAERLEA